MFDFFLSLLLFWLSTPTNQSRCDKCEAARPAGQTSLPAGYGMVGDSIGKLDREVFKDELELESKCRIGDDYDKFALAFDTVCVVLGWC